MEQTNKVLAGIAKVSGALAQEGISKDRKNQQQGYNFRGIDDVLNALAPLLSAENLVVIPTVGWRECVERVTQKGTPLFYVTVAVQFRIMSAEDGSEVTSTVYGEAMDSADKATNKAMSAAYKYWAILTFCIPTEGDNDADITTHTPQATTKPATGPLEDRAKGFNAKPGLDAEVPEQVLGVLDKLNNMTDITAKCTEYKPMAAKEGWDKSLFRYWQMRDNGFKSMKKEVFGDE